MVQKPYKPNFCLKIPRESKPTQGSLRKKAFTQPSKFLKESSFLPKPNGNLERRGKIPPNNPMPLKTSSNRGNIKAFPRTFFPYQR